MRYKILLFNFNLPQIKQSSLKIEYNIFFTCYLTGDNQYSSQFPGEKIFYILFPYSWKHSTVESKDDFQCK